ncbi:MAG: hypothetical protein ACR2MQ_05670 [Gemmatimonadaceae bacterium]
MDNDISNDIKFDEPLSAPVIDTARALYAPPSGDAYWAQLEARVMSRIAESAAGRWWVVVGGWAHGGLAAAAAILVAAAVGMLMMHVHSQEVRVAYESATQAVPAESVVVPTGALSERDGPDTRGATFRDVISQ